MTNFDRLGRHPDTALYNELAWKCERLAASWPERFDVGPTRQHLTDPSEGNDDSSDN